MQTLIKLEKELRQGLLDPKTFFGPDVAGKYKKYAYALHPDKFPEEQREKAKQLFQLLVQIKQDQGKPTEIIKSKEGEYSVRSTIARGGRRLARRNTMPILQPKAKLSCFEFGHQLLETRDLDPVYVLLHEAQLDQEHLLRWLLAYWCFYHVGTASWCTDPWLYKFLSEETQSELSFDSYWKRMLLAAGSKDYPRCHERRHFRGRFATEAVTKLYSISVQDRFAPLLGKQLTLQEVFTVVTGWYGFGNWIAFKVADMLERLGLAQVEFSAGSIFMFDSPRKGAELLWGIENGTTANPYQTTDKEQWAVNKILDTLGDYKAPPLFDRTINVQEAETILCKWKSYMGGHYKIGEDIEGCRNGLLRFPKSRTNQLLLKAGERTKLW